MQGRTWKGISEKKEIEIKSIVLERGGTNKSITNPTEKWRLALEDSTFIFYNNGTLYVTPSRSASSVISACLSEIDSLFIREDYKTYDYLIGFDETGKGEIFGCIYLAGVAIPNHIINSLVSLVSSVDSKKSQTYEYWLKVFQQINSFKKHGLSYKVLLVKPEEILAKNMNTILDRKYLILCKYFIKKYDSFRCRLVVDDYGVGGNFTEELLTFTKNDQEIVIISHSEDEYLETKIASLIAKYYRAIEIKTINDNTTYHLGSLRPGTGNLSDRQTRKWLEEWYFLTKAWPWFVKTTFKTIKEIESKKY